MSLFQPNGSTAEIVEVLQAVVGVIDMSNPDHESFADSAADFLDELLRHESPIRALLALTTAAPDPDGRPRCFANFYKCPCGAAFENSWPATCDDRCASCSPTSSVDR